VLDERLSPGSFPPADGVNRPHSRLQTTIAPACGKAKPLFRVHFISGKGSTTKRE
jgi:hypothetical protein